MPDPSETSGAAPRLSVVIPTRERPDELGRCLDRLEQQDAEGFEVIVVSDAAEADPGRTAAVAGTRPYPVRHLTGAREGASAARNAGWRAARAPVVLFIGDDVLASRGLVAEHLAVHRAEPGAEVGVLGRVVWARELRVSAFMRWLETGVQFDYDSIEGTEAGWGRFYTANASVKRELLERVGGFDEDLPYLYEDLDLAKRMHEEAGLRLLYRPAAAGEHLHAMTLDSYGGRMRMVARMERRFVAKHPEIRPYFRERLAAAAARPAARGRGARLIRLVPRRMPLLGARAWASAETFFCQQLAPAFEEGWAEEGQSEAERSASSGGSIPGGPK